MVVVEARDRRERIVRSTKSVSFRQMLPMPASARWSRRASEIVMVGPRRIAQAADRLVGGCSSSNPGSRRSGPSAASRRVEGFRPLLEELDDGRVEADRDGARDLDDETGAGLRPAPPLAGPVPVP